MARIMPLTPSRRLHTAALFCYALVAFLTMYPLWFNNGTHAAGYDYFHFHWNFWWIRQALASPDLSVYQSDYILFPFSNNLAYTTLSLFWYPLWAILEPITGTLTAMNAITYTGILLQGYVFFAFLRHEKAAPGPALLGGLVIQVTPLIRYFTYNTHINLIGWFWIPVHLYLWQQVVKTNDRRNLWRAMMWGGLQSLALWLMILTDLQFPLLLGFLLLPYSLLTLWRSPRKLSLILLGAASIGLALILLWFIGPLRQVLEGVAGTVPGVVEDRPGIPFPGGFLWAYGNWWHWNVPTLGGFVALAVLSALVISWRWRGLPYPRDRWLWFWLMLPPLVIALGPTLTIFGRKLPMPYRWLFDLTGGNFRMPWRIAPVYLIAGIIFAAKTWTPFLAHLTDKSRLALLTAGVFILALTLRLYQPGPIRPVLPAYDFYAAIGQEPTEDYVIIEAPTAAGTGELLIGHMDAITFQYYAISHGRRLINGFVARAPLDHFWYLRTDDPLLSWLGQRRELEPETVAAQLEQIIPTWPVGYIIVHKDSFDDPNGETGREIIGYLNSLTELLCPVYIEADVVAYRTTWHPEGCPARWPNEQEPGIYQIDIGTPDDQRFTGWGWYWMESFGGLTGRWTGERDTPALLYLDLPPGAYTVTLAAQAYEAPRDVTLLVNGEAAGTVNVTPDGIGVYQFELPAALVDDGKHLTLQLEYGRIEDEAAGGRRLGILVDWLGFDQDAEQ